MANGHGGRRLGAGRPKGGGNVTALRPHESGVENISPLQYLMNVVGDENADPLRRDRAAVALLPYTARRKTVLDDDDTGTLAPRNLARLLR